jgi:hypothetical protein
VSDALLNVAKNRTDSPSSPDAVHVHDIADVDEPAALIKGSK